MDYDAFLMKALSPLRRQEFAKLEQRLVKQLYQTLADVSMQAAQELQTALQYLNVTTPQGVAQIMRVLETQLQNLQGSVPQALEPKLAQTIEDIYRATKIAQLADLTNKNRVRNEGGLTSKLITFGTADRQAVAQLQKVRKIVIRQGWQQQLENFSDRSHKILLQATQQGLSRKALTDKLMTAFGNQVGSNPYWEIVGSAWMNKTRNRANLQTFSQAGIEHYRIVAVIDERTSAVCKQMNGQTFSVKTQLRHERQAMQAQSLEELKSLSPWLSVNFQSNAVGIQNSRGAFTSISTPTSRGSKMTKSPQQLQNLGVALPPFHALCRTTVVGV